MERFKFSISPEQVKKIFGKYMPTKDGFRILLEDFW
jgi:hypothetical protein